VFKIDTPGDILKYTLPSTKDKEMNSEIEVIIF